MRKLNEKAIGGAFAFLGLYLTILSGGVIGVANTMKFPPATALLGGVTATAGAVLWIVGLREAGKIGENRWLKFSSTHAHEKHGGD